jgi:hypothetical protein
MQTAPKWTPLVVIVSVMALGALGWSVGSLISGLRSDDCVTVTEKVSGTATSSRVCK